MRVIMIEMIIPNHYPAYWLFRVDDKGWFYVSTYESVKDNLCWDVFDEKGRYFAQIHSSFFPIVIRDNLMYTVEEDDDGYQYIKRYKVTWKI